MGPPLAASSSHPRKLRVLCLHGFRSSGKIMERQLKAKWDRSVLDLLDMVFLDGPFPAQGEAGIESFYEPPYYEWFQFEPTETGFQYVNLDESMKYICDFMDMQGPFDGLVGFSQGASMSAAVAGLQQQGLALVSMPALRFVILISGGVLDVEHAYYLQPLWCPSVHLIAKKDAFQSWNEELLLKFKDPIVIRHDADHNVPKLDVAVALPILNLLEEVRDQGYHRPTRSLL